MFGGKDQEILEAVEELTGKLDEYLEEQERPPEARRLSRQVVALKKELSDLKIDKDRVQEERSREKREVEHKVGLEKLRFEQEKEDHQKAVELAKRESKLSVREEALKEEREQFQKQMDFMQARFGKEIEYVQDIMGQILKRLPTFEVEAMLSNGSRRDGDGAV